MSHGQTWDSRDVDYEVGSDSLDTTSLPARRQPECWPEFAGIHNVKQVQAPLPVTNAVSTRKQTLERGTTATDIASEGLPVIGSEMKASFRQD
jgi:hypothetical protein